MAIGGAITSATAGSVLFAGTSGVLQQDNANLFWDDTNNRLGIGTSTPTFTLDVNGNSRVTGTFRQKTSGGSNYFDLVANADGSNPYITAFKSGSLEYKVEFGATIGASFIVGATVLIGNSSGTAVNAKVGGLFAATSAIESAGGVFGLSSTTNNYIVFQQSGSSSRGTIGFATGTSYLQIRTGAATNLTDGTLSTVFFTSGNVSIGTSTTDAGFKLDVNGTARVSGQTTITGSTTSSSAVGQGLIINPTLVAAANGDTLIATDISSTFTNGAFTGVRNILLRLNGSGGGIYGFNSGNFSIGNITDNGYKCEVTGTLNVTGATTLQTTTIGTALNMNASISFGSGGTTRNIFFYNPASAAQRTGIGYFGSGSNNGGMLLACYGALAGADILFGFGVDTSTATVANTKMALFNSTGNLSLGGAADIASAQLQVTSTTKGFLPPRMTTSERNAIASPATGLQVYDTTLGSLNVYNGTSWIALGAGGGGSVDELQVALISQVYG